MTAATDKANAADRNYTELRRAALAKRYTIGDVQYRIKPPSIKTMAELPREIETIMRMFFAGDGKVKTIDIMALPGQLRELVMTRMPQLISMIIVPAGKKWSPEIAADTSVAIVEHDIDLDTMLEICLDFTNSSPLAKDLLLRGWNAVASQITGISDIITQLATRLEKTISTYVQPSQTVTPSDTPPSSNTSPPNSEGSSQDGRATSNSASKPRSEQSMNGKTAGNQSSANDSKNPNAKTRTQSKD